MVDVIAQYEALERQIKANNPKVDANKVRAAFEYANAHHGPQLRKSGEPYITHPIAVAEIINELGLDVDSIVAALLHDCIEDTDSTHDEIAKLFGEPVAELVEGVTKLTRMQYTSKEDEQMENLRKMFMAMSKDVRVILIKLCDRLHNMRTLQYQSERKQKEKSLETMEIYAPIAHRLGMQRIKWELEDISLRYLDPIGYSDVQRELDALTTENGDFLESARRNIENRLAAEGLHCTVYGRLKHIYSIYRKMYSQSKAIKEIFDIYAFRVIVDDISNCYNVLGCIHDMYRPMLGRFKDYIGTPKPNGYQSLHTTVIGKEGVPFEVQIRTWGMHQTAEYGVAAHWKYKQGMNGSEEVGTEKEFEWVRKLLESQQDTDPDEFVRTLKVDLFADEVFVFTPNGDVKSLPAGATPIDFAYAIHSAVGNAMTGARVNGRIVTFDSTLKNGDIVEIITSKSARGPSRDWMKICKSNEARNKIRQWFKKERREENIATGRAAFESELKHVGLSVAAITASAEVLDALLKRVRFGALDELYAAIGYGGMSAQKAAGRMKEELTRMGRLERQAAERQALQEAAAAGETIYPSGKADAAPKARHSNNGIIVEGLDNCMVKFSKCCTPVPGDPVVGFITRGYGVSVHRKDCVNAQPDRRKPEEAGRWVNVDWAETEQSSFRTSLDLSAKDRDGLALDVAMALSAQKVKVNNLMARSQPDGYALISLELSVKDKNELAAVMNKLSGISGVFLVKRAGG